jgi:hypothetical protein
MDVLVEWSLDPGAEDLDDLHQVHGAAEALKAGLLHPADHPVVLASVALHRIERAGTKFCVVEVDRHRPARGLRQKR